MAPDGALLLGPKGSVYIELARAEWRAPLERPAVRRSLVTAVLSVALIIMGIVGAITATSEALALAMLGGIGLATTYGDLQRIRHEFEESRRIGWVEVVLDEEQLTLGDPFTLRLTWHARGARRVLGGTIRLEQAAWVGTRAGAAVTHAVVAVPASDGAVPDGDEWRTSTTLRFPAEATPSFYDADRSLRWTLDVELRFEGAAPWRRRLPVLVYPAPT